MSVLELEPIEVNLFRGHSPNIGWKRIFGGQAIGQALMAACRTVEDRAPHSLHCYFILPGDPQVPIIYEVGRLRDGKSFTTRRITAIQHGQAIFSMIASFHREEESSIEHQLPMPQVPMPEQIKDIGGLEQKLREVLPQSLLPMLQESLMLELRPVEVARYFGTKLDDAQFNIWFRIRHPLPDDPMMHRCALAYASDMSILDAAMAPHGDTLFSKDYLAASLDHALWFHRPFRADEWLLYSQDSPTSGGNRAMGRGLIFDRHGALVASAVQEGVIRRRRKPT